MVSSFLVAARSHPTMPNPTPEQIQDQEKTMADTLETTLRSRTELRRMLSLIEENLSSRDGNRRDLLEDDLRSLPSCGGFKRRKLDPDITDDADDFDSLFPFPGL